MNIDVGEENNVADQHPDVIQKIEEIMRTAVVPSEYYPIGKKYKGESIWKKKV